MQCPVLCSLYFFRITFILSMSVSLVAFMNHLLAWSVSMSLCFCNFAISSLWMSIILCLRQWECRICRRSQDEALRYSRCTLLNANCQYVLRRCGLEENENNNIVMQGEKLGFNNFLSSTCLLEVDQYYRVWFCLLKLSTVISISWIWCRLLFFEPWWCVSSIFCFVLCVCWWVWAVKF